MTQLRAELEATMACYHAALDRGDLVEASSWRVHGPTPPSDPSLLRRALDDARDAVPDAYPRERLRRWGY